MTYSKREMIAALRSFLSTKRNYKPLDGYHDDGVVTLSMRAVNRMDELVRRIESAEVHGTLNRINTDNLVLWLSGDEDDDLLKRH
jgi:hypothetical protein